MVSYTPHDWRPGEIVTDDKLDRMETGIADFSGSTDAQIQGVLADSESGTYEAVQQAAHAALDSTIAGKVGEGENLVNVTRFASLADAISTANTTAGSTTVYVPAGTWSIDDTLPVGKNVTLKGDGSSSVIQVASTVTHGLRAYGSIEDIEIHAQGNVNSAIVQVYRDDVSIRRVRVVDTAQAASYGVDVSGSYSNIAVEHCTFSGVDNCIRLRGPVTDCRIAHNRITSWGDRGIWVIADSAGGSNRARIVGNTITDQSGAGTPRYPIRVEAPGVSHRHIDVDISHNMVVGTGTSYNDTTTPGTADQISATDCDGIVVIGNTSTYGGDGAFALSDNTRLTMTGNRAEYADTAGIYLGWATAGETKDSAVSGNVFYNCGQNRNNDRAGSRSGIWCVGTNVTISGNTFTDDQATPTMLYGIVFSDCTNVTAGPNVMSGMVTSEHWNKGGNTNVTKVSTEALA